MIFYKSMIAGAVEIARAEKDDPGLSCVLFDKDGSIAACNRWAIYAAQPTLTKLAVALPFPSGKVFETACAVSIAQLTGLLRSIPADKQFKGMLEHISAEQDGQFLNIEFNDGRSVIKQKLRCSKVAEALRGWRARLKEIESKKGSSAGNFVYNRARLVSVVNSIEAACKYNGEFAFVEKHSFASGEVWRSFNEISGQAVLVAHITPSAGNLPTKTDWEKGISRNKIVLNIKKKYKNN